MGGKSKSKLAHMVQKMETINKWCNQVEVAEVEVKKEKEEEMEEEDVEIGTCLVVEGMLRGNVKVAIILDSGAGVTIVGRRFL